MAPPLLRPCRVPRPLHNRSPCTCVVQIIILMGEGRLKEGAKSGAPRALKWRALTEAFSDDNMLVSSLYPGKV